MNDITTTNKRIHPLVATAAVALILVSLVGVAAITGVLPNSHSTASPKTESAASLAQLTADDKLANDVRIVQAPPKPVVNPSPQQKTIVAQAARTSAPVPAASAVIQADRGGYAERNDYSNRTSNSERNSYSDRNSGNDRNNDRAGYAEPAQREQYREPVRVAAVCNSCGRVETVSAIRREPEQTSGVGVAAGAVIGGLLGNQVGGGNGRTLATVAGAVGGGMAGNEVERRTRGGSTSYQVRVRMEDGSVRSFPFSSAPQWNAGDRVQVVNGQLANRG